MTDPVQVPVAALVGSLDGIRVVDFTRVVSGPYATMILADHGADVIKIESPGDGDETRMFPPHLAGESTYYMSMNRNKRGVLDLRQPEDIEKALRLATTADVLVHNSAPVRRRSSASVTRGCASRIHASCTAPSAPTARRGRWRPNPVMTSSCPAAVA